MNTTYSTQIQELTLAELSAEVVWDDFFSAATDRLEEWGQAYVRYHGQKIEVEIESTFMGSTGRMWANVKAIEGYPFLSADVQAQGETSGAWNCNGYRMLADFVTIEPPFLSEPPAPLDEQVAAEAATVTEWLGSDTVSEPHKMNEDWGDTSDEYKKSQPYHNDLYPY